MLRARSSTSLVTLAAALVLVASGCSRRPAAVKLGYQRVGPYLAFFVARDKGFFAGEGVEVEAIEFPSSNVLAQAQVAGQVDGSGFISFPVLFGLEQHAPGQSVCELVLPMTQRSRFAAVVVPSASPVRTPGELRGGKIAVYPSSTNVIFARMMLEKLFGSADAAEIVQVPPATLLTLLGSGQVAAAIGPDPMPATAVTRGIGRVLVYAPDARFVLDPMPVGCATFSRAFHAAHPEAVARVRRALERAVDYLRDAGHHDEVQAILARATGADAAVARALGELDYWKLGEVDVRAVQGLADLLAREHVLAGGVDAARLFAER